MDRLITIYLISFTFDHPVSLSQMRITGIQYIVEFKKKSIKIPLKTHYICNIYNIWKYNILEHLVLGLLNFQRCYAAYHILRIGTALSYRKILLHNSGLGLKIVVIYFLTNFHQWLLWPVKALFMKSIFHRELIESFIRVMFLYVDYLLIVWL